MDDLDGLESRVSLQREDSQWSLELSELESDGVDRWNDCCHGHEAFATAILLSKMAPDVTVHERHVFGPQEEDGLLDFQGYLWEDAQHRALRAIARFEHIMPYHNIPENHEGALDVLKPDFYQRGEPEDDVLFRFHKCSPQAQPDYFHFQLRNLLGSASVCEWYYMAENCLMSYNSATETSHLVLDPLNDEREVVKRMSDMTISTLCVKEDVICVGGQNGEFLAYSLMSEDVQGVLLRKNPERFSYQCINSADIWTAEKGKHLVAVSTNCETVDILTLPDLSQRNEVRLEFSANYASLKPFDENVLALVGDSCEGAMFDLRSNKEIARLRGHMDHSFAIAWHPSGNEFVTGSQDKSVRVWDSRKLDISLDVIPTYHAEVRSLKYSPDGRFLAIAEPTDVVTLYNSAFSRKQDVSFFAEACGVAFSPDSSTLMLALKGRNRHRQDPAYCMMEFVVES